jgi:hypothetical protein
MHYLDVLFLLNVYNGFKFCPSFLETLGFRVHTRYFRDFPFFAIGSSRKNCPSARCASAANVVCKYIDIFIKHLVALNHILKLRFGCQ